MFGLWGRGWEILGFLASVEHTVQAAACMAGRPAKGPRECLKGRSSVLQSENFEGLLNNFILGLPVAPFAILGASRRCGVAAGLCT